MCFLPSSVDVLELKREGTSLKGNREENKMRIKNLTNLSNEDINLRLMNGAEITLPPNSAITNTDIVEVESVRDKVKFTEDLTEITNKTGKRMLLD